MTQLQEMYRTFKRQIQDSLEVIEREFFVDNLLVQIHSIIEMILVDGPCAVGI